MSTPADRVAHGARVLDEHTPGWANDLANYPDLLDMGDKEWDLLALLADTGRHIPEDVTNPDDVNTGMTVPNQLRLTIDQIDAAFDNLTDLWRAEVRRRADGADGAR